MRYELQQVLSELASAARSIRVLAEYLEHNPDALLRGKPGGSR
jgi:paraquat-inducible protein B